TGGPKRLEQVLPTPGSNREIGEHRQQRQREPIETGVNNLACDAAQIDVVQHEPQQRCGQRQHDQSPQMRSHERQKRLLLYRSSAVVSWVTLHVVVEGIEAPL